MATPATIDEAVDQTARSPKSASTDKGRVESHDIGDLLKAKHDEAGQTAASKNHFGVRIVKLKSPGAG